MLSEELVTQALSLGISGLLFVMWWNERQERARGVAQVQEALQHARQTAAATEHLLDVIRANTDALAGLREELRAGRLAETEWRGRVAGEFERLQRVLDGDER